MLSGTQSQLERVRGLGRTVSAHSSMAQFRSPARSSASPSNSEYARAYTRNFLALKAGPRRSQTSFRLWEVSETMPALFDNCRA